MNYIKSPNLPENRIIKAAISSEAGDTEKRLKELNIETIKINKLKTLPAGIASHADLRVLHLKDNKVLITQSDLNEHLFDSLKNDKFNIKIIPKQINKNYPEDVLLNAKIIGKYILCNTKTISIDVLKYAEEAELTIIDVKQGYTGCSVCVLNENSIITDDLSIYKAAQNFLNDVTLIEKNSIELSGYNYGFIGGCSGKISETEVAFNGEIASHISHNKIYDSLTRNRLTAVELIKGPLKDIGGIIPLMEK